MTFGGVGDIYGIVSGARDKMIFEGIRDDFSLIHQKTGLLTELRTYVRWGLFLAEHTFISRIKISSNVEKGTARNRHSFVVAEHGIALMRCLREIHDNGVVSWAK